jgi:hypothetical protein
MWIALVTGISKATKMDIWEQGRYSTLFLIFFPSLICGLGLGLILCFFCVFLPGLRAFCLEHLNSDRLPFFVMLDNIFGELIS